MINLIQQKSTKLNALNFIHWFTHLSTRMIYHLLFGHVIITFISNNIFQYHTPKSRPYDKFVKTTAGQFSKFMKAKNTGRINLDRR